MIRVIQRHLIIPRGDTGKFTLPLLPGAQQGDVAVFSIYDPLTQKIVLQRKILVGEEDELSFNFTRDWTINIEPSDRYVWDVRIYHEAVYSPESDIQDDAVIPIDGSSIDSYYAAFGLPVCEIKTVP